MAVVGASEGARGETRLGLAVVVIAWVPCCASEGSASIRGEEGKGKAVGAGGESCGKRVSVSDMVWIEGEELCEYRCLWRES